jgi:hypothetical protein
LELSFVEHLDVVGDQNYLHNWSLLFCWGHLLPTVLEHPWDHDVVTRLARLGYAVLEHDTD